MNVDGYEGHQQPSLEQLNEKRSLSEYKVEEGCTRKFISFGNLITHIIAGEQHRVVKKKLHKRYSYENVLFKIRKL